MRRDWEARTYERVSGVQEGWARDVLARLQLRGDETVLDAGCGSGRVTRLLVERLPEGRVVAVDASPSMVEGVRAVLRPQDEALVADLVELELGEPVDAVFSAAVFHWVLDHDALFARLHAALRPGGVLEAQCGGEGNIAGLIAVAGEVMAREPYAPWFEGWRGPWLFSSPDAARERLEAARFAAVRCWLEGREARPDDGRAFLRVVCLGPHLERLPEELREPFVDDVLRAMGEPLVLRYVRLNISARRA